MEPRSFAGLFPQAQQESSAFCDCSEQRSFSWEDDVSASCTPTQDIHTHEPCRYRGGALNVR